MVKNKKSCKCKDETTNCKCNKLTSCNYLCNNTCCNTYYSEPSNPKPRKEKKRKYGKYGKTNKLGKVRIEREGNKVVITDTNKALKSHVEDTSAYRTQNALINSLSTIPLLANLLPKTNNNKPFTYYTGSYGEYPTNWGRTDVKIEEIDNEEEQEKMKSISYNPIPKYSRIAKKVFNKQNKETVKIIKDIYENRNFEDKTMEDIIREFREKYGEDATFHRGITTKEGLIGAVLKFEFDRLNKTRGGAVSGGSPIFNKDEEQTPLTDQIEEASPPDPMSSLLSDDN